MKNKKEFMKWIERNLLGDCIMHLTYSLAIWIIIIIPQDIWYFKYGFLIMLTIMFYGEVKQNYENNIKISKDHNHALQRKRKYQ